MTKIQKAIKAFPMWFMKIMLVFTFIVFSVYVYPSRISTTTPSRTELSIAVRVKGTRTISFRTFAAPPHGAFLQFFKFTTEFFYALLKYERLVKLESKQNPEALFSLTKTDRTLLIIYPAENADSPGNQSSRV